MIFDPLKYDEDEARGTLERALPGGYIVDGDGGGLVLSSDALDAYRDAVAARVRDEVATFIRDNINMKGLDFADAEDVAKWLEERR
ncbi:hypothetical protein ACFRNT_11265 [Streptomyces sp. NPDC056697]|uniref:hypothetical protein n=1 Tax=Streptomyces sp. NPDC056697 TaxID=3345915 RepID=UPI00367FAF72